MTVLVKRKRDGVIVHLPNLLYPTADIRLRLCNDGSKRQAIERNPRARHGTKYRVFADARRDERGVS